MKTGAHTRSYVPHPHRFVNQPYLLALASFSLFGRKQSPPGPISPDSPRPTSGKPFEHGRHKAPPEIVRVHEPPRSARRNE